MSELRKDPITGRWVIIAPERARRPVVYTVARKSESGDYPKEKSKDKGTICPFCPGNEHMTGPSILSYNDEKNKWKVRVFANKFPALRVEGDVNRKGEGIYDVISGVGAHEIIIDTPFHEKGIADLEVPDIQLIIQAYQARVQDLYNDQRLRYVLIYNNYGFNAGATIDHSHSQLIATPIVPENLKEEYEHTRRYFLFKERCLFCDVLNQELDDGRRIILENEDFVVFAPYASRVPFEMHILPKMHQNDFLFINSGQINSLAKIFKEALLRLKIALDNPSYNFIVHSSPNRRAKHIPGQWQTIQEDYHWHIEILPRLSYLAGFEWGTGFYINPSLPEETAKFLRSIRIDK